MAGPASCGIGNLASMTHSEEAPRPESSLFRLDYKIALVTGAARGLGQGLALALRRR